LLGLLVNKDKRNNTFCDRMPPMNDQEIIKIFLDTQEWKTFECKRAAIKPADLLETVVAFANSDGG
jgi:hypothetical protein